MSFCLWSQRPPMELWMSTMMELRCDQVQRCKPGFTTQIVLQTDSISKVVKGNSLQIESVWWWTCNGFLWISKSTLNALDFSWFRCSSRSDHGGLWYRWGHGTICPRQERNDRPNCECLRWMLWIQTLRKGATPTKEQKENTEIKIPKYVACQLLGCSEGFKQLQKHPCCSSKFKHLSLNIFESFSFPFVTFLFFVVKIQSE